MGLIKTTRNLAVAGAIFYAGMLYQGGQQQDCEQDQSIEYKVLSLSQDMATQPELVKATFEKYDAIINDPKALEKKLEQYNLK